MLAKSFRFILIIFLATVSISLMEKTEAEVSIYLIGDSTMADKAGTAAENPERGWGQLLPTYFNEKVAVYNYALNGRSSKSFIDEGHWENVLNSLKYGDYVFIQFGHNDQKEKDPKRYTNPWTGYRRNLEKFVNETRAKGAYPVLFSSIVRRIFNEYGTLIDTHGEYPFVTRTVADDLGVPFIDMQLLTEDYVNALGEEKSKEIYLWVEPGQYHRFPDGKEDNTHLSMDGASAYADLVITELSKIKSPLAEYIVK